MRKITLIIGMVLCTYLVQAQYSFPLSLEEDKDSVMSKEYWDIWNLNVQKKINEDIEKNRKADGCITLLDIKDGSEVSIEQISHDFVFGAHIFNFNQLGTPERNRKYRDVFGSLFNSATIGFYWKTFEMEPNRLRFKEEYWDTEEYWNKVDEPYKQPHWRRPATDPVVAFCASKGIRMHGHTLIWGTLGPQIPKWIIENFVPDEEKLIINNLRNLNVVRKGATVKNEFTELGKKTSADEMARMLPNYTKILKLLFEKRILEISNYYGDRIQSWDIVNESATDYSNGAIIPNSKLCKSHYGFLPGDYPYNAFQIAQKSFPANVLLNINDYKSDHFYAEEVSELLSRNCKVDIMGSQMHIFDPKQSLEIANGKKQETPDMVYEKMNAISKAGLPIHLSEITIPSPGKDKRSLMIQAVIAQNLYRLWFSIKPMMGITWWNMVDDCGYAGEPSVSGLFTRNMEPKPAYYALNNLINNEWKTNIRTKVNSKGLIKFRGFRGLYRITWQDKNGNIQSKNYNLK